MEVEIKTAMSFQLTQVKMDIIRKTKQTPQCTHGVLVRPGGGAHAWLRMGTALAEDKSSDTSIHGDTYR